MNKSELRERVLREPHFVNAKRFNNDQLILEERYPDGCPDHVMAGALVISVEEVQAEYERFTLKLRELMGVKT